MSRFKLINDYETRRKLYEKIHTAYPDRYPVIVDRKHFQDPDIDKHKFLVPNTTTMAFVINQVRSRMASHSSTDTTLFFVNNTLVRVIDLIDNVYEKYHDEDGFLYLTYTSAPTFG